MKGVAEKEGGPEAAAAPLAGAAAPDIKRKLVVLCVHGFRQNGRQFKGRLAGLQKKLADVATFVFIDAPHVLPLWYKPTPEELEQQQQQQRQPQELPAPKRAWLLSSDLMAAQQELQLMFQHQQQQQQQQHHPSASTTHSHELAVQDSVPAESSTRTARASAVWQVAPADVATPQQHMRQCTGWQQSWDTIQQALTSTEQQIDGLLGFSQGSAVVAIVAALLQQQQQQQRQSTDRSEAAGTRVKFMILASGFVSPAPEHHELLLQQQPLQLPSLHVYAAASVGSDRQIQQQLSDELYDLCHPATRQRILHDGGHLIPCRKDVVNEIKGFLQQFT